MQKAACQAKYWSRAKKITLQSLRIITFDVELYESKIEKVLFSLCMGCFLRFLANGKHTRRPVTNSDNIVRVLLSDHDST